MDLLEKYPLKGFWMGLENPFAASAGCMHDVVKQVRLTGDPVSAEATQRVNPGSEAAPLKAADQ
jgi:hypothetical protein